jgi:hypothetical protein
MIVLISASYGDGSDDADSGGTTNFRSLVEVRASRSFVEVDIAAVLEDVLRKQRSRKIDQWNEEVEATTGLYSQGR